MRAGKLNPLGKVSQPGWEKIHEVEITASTPASQLLLTFQGVDSQTPAAADSGQAITWAGTSKLIGPKAVTPVGTAHLDDLKHPITFVGTAALDDMKPTVTFVGTAQIDTAQKVFGRSSLLLDGNSDYITLPDSEDWNFGTGDFTIDCWVRLNSVVGFQSICAQGDYSTQGFEFVKYNEANGYKLGFFASNSSSYVARYTTVNLSWETDQWYHLAFERHGTTALIFRDGVSLALAETTAFGTNSLGETSANLYIGASQGAGGARYLNGWLDEVRVSKGIARWTSNFDVPTVEYVPDDYAKLILHFNGADAAVTTKDFARHTKFGDTALYLDGNSDYLTIPDSNDWNFGDSPFTIDLWVKFAADPGIAVATFYEQYQGVSDRISFYIENNNLCFQVRDTAIGTAIRFTTPFNPEANVWYHLAVVRVNTDDAATAWRLFINGVSQTLSLGSGSWNYTIFNASGPVRLGYGELSANYINGHLDEVRVSKVARWTESFTPPTAQHEPDEDTKLLLHFDGYDGDVTTEDNAEQPKFGGTCLYLDGNSDYVTLPDSEDWYFGTGNFTIDLHVRFASIGQDQIFVNQFVDINNRWHIGFYNDEKYIMLYMISGSAVKAYYTFPFDPKIDTWYHIAVVRNGTSVLGFIDGVSKTGTVITAISTNDVGNIASALFIGSSGGSTTYFNGYMDEVRISKGIARWTENFTPSTASHEKDEHTALLLHFDGYNGQTHMIDSAQRGKVGSSALWLDGNSDYVTVPDSDDWHFGTGDFTIDFWVKFTDLSVHSSLFAQRADANNHITFSVSNTGVTTLYCRTGSTDRATYSRTTPVFTQTGAWYHVALVRQGASVKFYVNGTNYTFAESTAAGDFGNIAAAFNIGSNGAGTGFFNGKIDGFRITKGTALWTSDFTPPTTPEDYVGTKAIAIFGLEGNKDEQYMLDAVLVGTALDNLIYRINGDAGTNYGMQELRGLIAVIAASRAVGSAGYLCGVSALGEVGQGSLLLYAKSGNIRTGIEKDSRNIAGTTIGQVTERGRVWNNSVDEITSILIRCSLNFAAGSIVSLYRRIEA